MNLKAKNYFKIFMQLKTYFFTCCLLILSACDAPYTEKLPQEFKHHQITITTETNINGKFAISVDFVQIYDKPTFETIKTMDAKTFFARKNQLILDNPENLTIWTFDFISNQTNCYQFPNHKNYWGIIIFLHFFDSESTRIILPLSAYHTRLHIDDGNFTISTDNKGNSKCIKLDEGGNL